MDAEGEQEVVLQTDSGNELVLTYKDGKCILMHSHLEA
mgnify:CR=1 FL=1